MSSASENMGKIRIFFYKMNYDSAISMQLSFQILQNSRIVDKSGEYMKIPSLSAGDLW
jgi:hypothetical protein